MSVNVYRSLMKRVLLAGGLWLLFTAASAQDPDTLPPPPPQEMPSTVEAVPVEEVESAEGETDFTGFWIRELWAQEPERPVRRVSDSTKQKLLKDPDFWYLSEPIHAEKKETPSGSYTPLGERSWFQTLVWLLIIGGFGFFLVIWLSGNNIRLFRRKPAAIYTTEDEGLPEDIFAIRYDQEIQKALRQGQYRLAVRLRFLRILRLLTDRQLIRYQQDKTNLEYLLQVRQRPWYDEFFRVTRHFEYAWYGQFPVDADVYRVIAGSMDVLEHKINAA